LNARMSENSECYTPVEICNWFDIARTTLFRWEDTGVIPKAGRGSGGERIYDREHLEKLREVVIKKMCEDCALLVRQNPDSLVMTEDMAERLYRIRFFSSPNPAGELHKLWQLSSAGKISKKTEELLVDYAKKLPFDDLLRARIYRMLSYAHPNISTQISLLTVGLAPSAPYTTVSHAD
jgi:hypothetical protein